jgi:micrococcal nuclease
VDGRNQRKELIRPGLAWHYKKYSSDQILADLEILARRKWIGFWLDAHAIPPWEYLRSKK